MPEIKTEMLSITGMRWYMAAALECSSVVVDTMSWRGLVTHVKKQDEWMVTFYRNVLHGPAECADGTKQWWVDDQHHRLNGPAVEYSDGGKEWWVCGKRHRLGGPAIEYTNGYTEWCIDGKRHCLDGPAVMVACAGMQMANFIAWVALLL